MASLDVAEIQLLDNRWVIADLAGRFGPWAGVVLGPMRTGVRKVDGRPPSLLIAN